MKSIYCILVLFALILAMCAVQPLRAQSVIGKVVTGMNAQSIAYDSGKGEIFVANGAAGTVSVISDSSNTLVANITVGFDPRGIAYDSGSGEIYVVYFNGVSVISTGTDKVVADIPAGLLTVRADNPPGPAIAYDSAKDEMFMENPYSIDHNGNAVFGISVISGNTLTQNITTFGAMAYDSGKGEIFVSTGTTVSVISDTTNAVVANVTVGSQTTDGIAYDSAKGEIFVGGSNGTVYILSDTQPAAAPTASTVPASTTPTSNPSLTINPTATSPNISPSAISSPAISSSPTPNPITIGATTQSGATINLAISGNITSSQITNFTIATNQSDATTTLSFTLTGESGTTGFSNVTIPKTAILSGITPTIYIDNQVAQEQGYSQDANNYYVWYSTHFSTHEVSIVFAATSQTPEFPWFATLPLFLAATTLTLVYVRKLKQQKKPKLL